MVKKFLILESLAYLVTSVYVYYLINGDLWLFIIVLFTPDISMLGYLKDKNLGSVMYNFVHNYALALITILGGYLLSNQLILSLGIILFAHISLDRVFGFGLKYPTNFKDTHLQKI